MKTHRRLRQVGRRTSGSVRGAHSKPSTGKVRAWAAGGILILALVLGSLGAFAAASSGHGSVGHANAHQPARNLPRSPVGYQIISGHFISMPWMY
jgi:hypothetical protein